MYPQETFTISNVSLLAVQAVECIPKKWQTVLSINLKTHDSIALPIWHSLPVSTHTLVVRDLFVEHLFRQPQDTRITRYASLALLTDQLSAALTRPSACKRMFHSTFGSILSFTRHQDT